MSLRKTREYAVELDQTDILKAYRNRIHIPRKPDGQEKIYFCGNSLGLQPKATKGLVDEILNTWEQEAVDGHFSGPHPWFSYHEFLTEKLARLVGARPIEVVVMNSLTVNLHLMMVSFYKPVANRNKLMMERQVFPSDRYAVESQIRYHGLEPRETLIEVVPCNGESTIRTEDLLGLIDRWGHQVALILLPGVQYYTGQAFDLKQITEAGHKKGCIVGFDLAHAAGNLVLKLHDWDVDFAVWCSYKYLNAGPGSVAGCFIHERYARQFNLPRFAGWWGHDKKSRFQMPQEFSLLAGAEGWQVSNPPILSMAPLIASLELFDEAGMDLLRHKSEKLTHYLEILLLELCGDRVSIITPSQIKDRGSQLSLKIEGAVFEGKLIREKLSKAGVVCDWREPDVIRISPVPLYNRYTEVFDFVHLLRSILS